MSLVVWMTQSRCHAVDQRDETAGSALTGEFAIGKDGRLILLPVEVDGEKHQFMVDTGACRTGFDTRLRDVLGDPRGTQVLRTPAGRTHVETYHWPRTTLGGQTLRSDRLVAAVDFSELRQASNQNIDGVIGIDVLKDCRIQVDFDRGILRFLKELPIERRELGIRIPMEFDDDEAPHLVAGLPNGDKERFLIDTGATGNSLRPTLFDRLVEQDLLRLGGAFTSVTVAGEVQGSRGFLRQLTVGSFSLDGLRMARVNPSSLGLRFFSRFVVTFDFPGRAVYLRPGTQFDKPEPHATSGMSLIWEDGKAVVKAVKANGPAEQSGIRASDTILHVNDRKISAYDHFSLRELLTTEPGRTIRLRFVRGNSERTVELTLADD